MNMNNSWNDPRTNPPTMTLNPPGCSRSDPCWKNVEMTGYVKDVTDNTDIENFA
jgi:hypothetical protein